VGRVVADSAAFRLPFFAAFRPAVAALSPHTFRRPHAWAPHSAVFRHSTALSPHSAALSPRCHRIRPCNRIPPHSTAFRRPRMAPRFLHLAPRIQFHYLIDPEPCRIKMRRGAVVSFEKIENQCCFASVLLDNKKLSILSFDVTPVSDEERDWALCAHRTIPHRIPDLPTLNSVDIKQRIHTALTGVDIFFIRDQGTLDVLTNILGFHKSKIHIVKRPLNPPIPFYCAPCANNKEFENCCINTVVCITNLLCNLRPDHLPPNLEIASAAHPFSFPGSVSRFALSAALPTAEVANCVRFTGLYDTEEESD
jgi:hypothetical protein